MAALGVAPDQVRATLEQNWSSYANDDVNIPMARLDVWLGRFDDAERKLRRVRADAAQPTRAMLASSVLLAELLRETGHGKEAARVAMDALSRRPADGGKSALPTRDPLPTLWGFVLSEGEGDVVLAAKAAEAVRAWEKRWAGDRTLWLVGPAALAIDGPSARAALSKGYDEPKVSIALGQLARPDFAARVAGIHRLAGDGERAVALYERTAKLCTTFEAPFASIRASFWLGELHREGGKDEDACKAYGRVLERWGSAKPPSETAKRAKKAFGELDCKAAP